MTPSGALGAVFAVLAALSWGGGDFSGGLASRRVSPYQVLALSALTGGILLAVFGWITREPVPDLSSAVLSAAGGVSGALGIAALYRALALGNMAIVAPIAAVVGAASPVLFNFLIEGPPDSRQQIGFAIALLGLWVVSGNGSRFRMVSRQSVLLALFAGLGFGGFFILIDQVAPGSNFLTLLVARLASLGVALIALAVLRSPLPGPKSQPVAVLAGLLDTGGNIFFLLATQRARLDVAVILASLYPAVTVLLARVLMKRKSLAEAMDRGRPLHSGHILDLIIFQSIRMGAVCLISHGSGRNP